MEAGAIRPVCMKVGFTHAGLEAVRDKWEKARNLVIFQHRGVLDLTSGSAESCG